MREWKRIEIVLLGVAALGLASVVLHQVEKAYDENRYEERVRRVDEDNRARRARAFERREDAENEATCGGRVEILNEDGDSREACRRDLWQLESAGWIVADPRAAAEGDAGR